MEKQKQAFPHEDVLKPIIESIISESVIIIKRLALLDSVSPGSGKRVKQFVIDLLTKETPKQNEQETNNLPGKE